MNTNSDTLLCSICNTHQHKTEFWEGYTNIGWRHETNHCRTCTKKLRKERKAQREGKWDYKNGRIIPNPKEMVYNNNESLLALNEVSNV